MNNNPLKKSNKTVLVTGASGGIGREIVFKFAQQGWNIIAHYMSSTKEVASLKNSVQRLGVNCEFVRADFASRKDLNGFITRVKALRIDSLINNAATPVVSRHFSGISIDDLEKTFMVNVFAPFLLASKIFAQMEARRFGRIVNISSIAAKYGGSAFSMHYGCSKRALEGLTKTLAREGARRGILVNTIRPGVINTAFYKKFPKDLKKRVAMIPLRRMGSPEDIAEMAYYLGSEKNNFITGETITIAGGE